MANTGEKIAALDLKIDDHGQSKNEQILELRNAQAPDLLRPEKGAEDTRNAPEKERETALETEKDDPDNADSLDNNQPQNDRDQKQKQEDRTIETEQEPDRGFELGL